MNRKSLVLGFAFSCGLILSSGKAYAREMPSAAPAATRLVTGMASGSGSTIGPGRALYVTEGKTGTALRVDPKTGEVTTFASGLPKSIIGIGGAMDIAFIGKTAYVLVTLVGNDVGGTADDIDGIYRVDGPNSHTIMVDIGAWSIDHPPVPDFFVPTGFQYAIESYQDGLIVTDGHHNRVLYVTLDGNITEMVAFGNVVPTGLALRGNTIYLTQAGPIPHLPEESKLISLPPKSPGVIEVASGAGLGVGLFVDVEFGPGNTTFALAQGIWDGPWEGAPAQPNTGALVVLKPDGTFSPIVQGLNQPTSMEFIGNKAYVVSLVGEIWEINKTVPPPLGH